MKVLIINYNRLILPMKLADWVAARGCEPIFIDNNSSYPPLLGYYEKQCPYQVLRMEDNYGSKVVWKQGIVELLRIEGNYIVTDSDLDLTGVPDDFVSVLEEGLRRYPQYIKCGLSLEINDLPDTVLAREVKALEKVYWEKPFDNVYFDAPVDTTFAMYRPGITPIGHEYSPPAEVQFLYATRTNRPYTAKHVPWYYSNVEDIPEDEQYYFTLPNKKTNYWSEQIRKELQKTKAMDYIITTYLTTAVDTQLRYIDGKWMKNIIKEKNDVSYILDWYVSVVKLGLNGIVLHDGLSEDFIKQFPRVRFKEIPAVPKDMQLYDYRWLLYLECFKWWKISNVFFTDVSDVKVVMNPFIQSAYNTHTLYCGDGIDEDIPKFVKTLKRGKWIAISLENEVLNKLPEFHKILTSDRPQLNPGTFGGGRELMLKFLKKIVVVIEEVKFRPVDITGDMSLFNYVMYKHFPKQIYCGAPVNSVFKVHENRNDVWFIHK